MVLLINTYRESRNLPTLARDPVLTAAAETHCALMARSAVLSHMLPGEPGLQARAMTAGYRQGFIGEVIAAGQKSPAEVVAAWKGSPPHNAILLGGQFSDIGGAVAAAADGTLYWCCDLGGSGNIAAVSLDSEALAPPGILTLS